MTATASSTPRPVVLCILDGWGYRAAREDNAIALAETPTWDRLMRDCPHALVETSGLDVGLPAGQMGNSEVGHMNIGAGRVVMQDLPRIDARIADNALETLPAMETFLAGMKRTGGTVHLLGLMSPGGVHSHQDHMAALAEVLCRHGLKVAIHAFMDGRDTAPRSGRGFLEKFLTDTRELPGLSVATVSGRYYAMDRDQRWDRVGKAYAALVRGEGVEAPSAIAAMEASYGADVSDEFVLPTVIGGFTGMQDGDGVLMANFRADRAREILLALLDPAFDGFDRGTVPAFAAALGMSQYSTHLDTLMGTLFPPEALTGILGDVVAAAGRKQLRIAETEKYAHVTFFLNGGEERQYEGEDRILIPSPKVATYDLQPQMSAPEVADQLVAAIQAGTYDLIVVNFANGDMVGHTGMLDAAIQAVQTLDGCLARLEAAVTAAGGTLLITADHGNCEMMRDPETGEPYTQHTVGKVYAVLVNGPRGAALHDGRLADLAPTVLALMGLPQPAAMTGRPLLGEALSAPRAAAG